MEQQPNDNRQPFLTPEQAKLVADHEDYVWWVARRVSPGNVLRNRAALEDVAAAVRFQLMKAARTYDGESATFITYVERLAFLYGARAVRVELNHGIKVPQYVITKYRPPEHASIDETRNGFDTGSDVPEPDRSGVYELPAEFWDKAASLLKPNEFELMKLITAGMTIKHASASLGFHHHTGEKLYKMALRVLKSFAADLEDYTGEAA